LIESAHDGTKFALYWLVTHQFEETTESSLVYAAVFVGVQGRECPLDREVSQELQVVFQLLNGALEQHLSRKNICHLYLDLWMK
jgi:hypothetical protein